MAAPTAVPPPIFVPPFQWPCLSRVRISVATAASFTRISRRGEAAAVAEVPAAFHCDDQAVDGCAALERHAIADGDVIHQGACPALPHDGADESSC